MNKGTDRLTVLKNKGKEYSGSIVGNSLLTGLFTLGAITSVGTGLVLPIGYTILTGFFGYGIVTSVKDKIKNNNQIKYEEEHEKIR